MKKKHCTNKNIQVPLKNPRREAKKCTTFVHNNNNAKKKDTKQNQAEKKLHK